MVVVMRMTTMTMVAAGSFSRCDRHAHTSNTLECSANFMNQMQLDGEPHGRGCAHLSMRNTMRGKLSRSL